MALLLRPQDTKDLITIAEAIEAIELGYREFGAYPIIGAPRRRIHSPAGVRVSTHPGGAHGLGVIGLMEHTEVVRHEGSVQHYPYRAHPVHLVHDSSSGHLLAILIGEINAKELGYSSVIALRTAATSGVGFKYLPRKNSKTVGLLGSGGQAEAHLLALKCLRPIESVKVYSRDPNNRKRFAEKMSKIAGVDIRPVDGPQEAIKGVDVVIAATNTNVPVFDGNWLEPGQHVTTIIGSNVSLVKGGWLSKRRREIDDTTVKRSDVIVVNSREQVIQDEQGDIFEPVQAGIIKWEQVHELGEMLNGKAPGRDNDRQITMHKNNVGLGIADLALAAKVVELAREQGRGQEIELPEPGSV